MPSYCPEVKFLVGNPPASFIIFSRVVQSSRAQSCDRMTAQNFDKGFMCARESFPGSAIGYQGDPVGSDGNELELLEPSPRQSAAP